MPEAHNFARLTQAGQLRRIGRLARTAVSRYDIEIGSIRRHAFATNLLYRVTSAKGQRYMLRMAQPGWRTVDDLRAEATWLDALATETDIDAPRILPAVDGTQVLEMQGSGVPSTWNASLMTWVDGRSLGRHLTAGNLRKMGELFARLHAHTERWHPPSGFITKRFEHWLSRGEDDVLFGSRPDIDDTAMQSLDRTRQWVEAEYRALDRSDLRVIHCDLWHENIKLDHGRLRPYDFEDTIEGFRLHDLAMGLLDLLETVGTKRYQEFLPRFRDGYEAHLEWPGGCLEAMQAGRMLWQLNWTARARPQALAPLLRRSVRMFDRLSHTGVLTWLP